MKFKKYFDQHCFETLFLSPVIKHPSPPPLPLSQALLKPLTKLSGLITRKFTVLHLSSARTDYIVFRLIASDVDECKNNAGMKTSVCANGQCQNTMKDYICVCNAGFRSDPTKKLCNGKNIIYTAGMAKKQKQNFSRFSFKLHKSYKGLFVGLAKDRSVQRQWFFNCTAAPSECSKEQILPCNF